MLKADWCVFVPFVYLCYQLFFLHLILIMAVDIIYRYFPDLTDLQRNQFAQLDALYREWNAKINVISRKDIDNLYEHHVLHSLGIARVIQFRPGTQIMDIGTGGGFPGIPWPSFSPNAVFKLIDSIGKKTKVAAAVAQAIGLQNVEVAHLNVMEEKRKFDFVVSRAVMNAQDLVKLVRKNVHHEHQNALPNGLICLKGGDVADELAPFAKCSEVWDLSTYFTEEFFETKRSLTSNFDYSNRLARFIPHFFHLPAKLPILTYYGSNTFYCKHDRGKLLPRLRRNRRSSPSLIVVLSMTKKKKPSVNSLNHTTCALYAYVQHPCPFRPPVWSPLYI